MTRTLAQLSLESFVADLAGTAPSPGAGAAGALALALAAACAGKAAAISLRHSPGDATLAGLVGELENLRHRALALATQDARSFETHLREGDARSAQGLADTGERVLSLAAALQDCCTALQGRVRQNMAGDLVAAAALLDAGRRIQHRNLDETSSGTADEARGPAPERFPLLLERTGWSAAELAQELDVDTRMVEAWCAGEEQPPRAVELAVAQLATRHRAQADSAADRTPGGR